MSKICKNALKLVHEASNSQIQNINLNLIDEIITEIKGDNQTILDTYEKEELEQESRSIIHDFYLEKISRNKRAILIYLNERLKKIKYNCLLYQGINPENITEKLSDYDNLFYNEYLKNYQNYYKHISLDLDMDLSKHLNPPSDSITVSVRANETIKNFKISKNSNLINIEKGNSYSFSRSDVEPYLQTGLFSMNE